VSRYRARLIPITPDIPEDARVAAVVNTYWQPISPKYAEIIGQAASDVSARCDDRAEYNLVADAVRSTFGTEIEFENMGGVRAPLVAGPITRGDVIAMDPFDNTVLAFSLPGREVKRILQQYAPAVSGLRYRIENGTLVEATIGGQPIDDDRVYSGTTNSYFATCALKGIELRETGRYRLDVLLDYIRRQGSVQPTYDGRRVILGSPLASLEKPMPSEGYGR
jgi:5'-nucleotidase